MARMDTTVARTHRFALSISGGISLGSYEAGVLTQLYRDLYDFNRNADIAGRARVAIDAVAGASAGSVTGLILSQGIALKVPPDKLEAAMRLCWVELLEIHNLLKSSQGAESVESLFTSAIFDDVVNGTLTIPPSKPEDPEEPIAFWITMTNLDGVPFVIDFNREGHAQATTALYALDYRDYVPFLISGDQIEMIEKRMVSGAGPDAGSDETWKDAVEAAKTSGAFPFAFPSHFQTRDLTAYPEYLKFREAVESNTLAKAAGEQDLHTTVGLPDKACFQFVDGGLFHNQPVGKCIDAVAYLNSRFPERDPDREENQKRAGRSFVIIEPEPQLPSDVERALTNSASAQAGPPLPLLPKILGSYFNTALYGDFQTAADTNKKIHALNEALQKLDTLGLPHDVTAPLKQQILKAVDLEDKTEITLQRIPHELPTSKRLACAFGGHFGGFFREDFRQADFITGKHESRQWFAEWLTLWLQEHGAAIFGDDRPITKEYTLSLLGAAPADPATEPIAPTGLTPLELAGSGWFPQPGANGKISGVARLAALTEDERSEILNLAEERGETLLEAWLNLPSLVVHPAAYILAHLFNNRWTKEPK
ncbi:hypothetical protein CCAX7_19940 [Capsulimonas corticalis]|uniref:Uncharacterized protein n=1 Tax=Capsulimonas corticalis TaxID=2219043 RepID=A0A402D2I2_9BACT|nr:patatin-like phospholipase family protein [Capsulimonas corticalis]BDI29943.1 hypothetical protein CCAX7_19940 [Capsulimonas corticalis]